MRKSLINQNKAINLLYNRDTALIHQAFFLFVTLYSFNLIEKPNKNKRLIDFSSLVFLFLLLFVVFVWHYE
jgi:hypothetical protein